MGCTSGTNSKQPSRKYKNSPKSSIVKNDAKVSINVYNDRASDTNHVEVLREWMKKNNLSNDTKDTRPKINYTRVDITNANTGNEKPVATSVMIQNNNANYRKQAKTNLKFLDPNYIDTNEINKLIDKLDDYIEEERRRYG